MPSLRFDGRIDLISLSKEAEDFILSQADRREVDIILRSIEILCEEILRFCLSPLSLVSADPNAVALAAWAVGADDRLIVVTPRHRFHLKKEAAPFPIVIEKMEDHMPEMSMKVGVI